MDPLRQDVRYAIRMCFRTSGFTIVAVLALALGIGANTAIFTIVNAVLIERLPYRDANRIVVWETTGRRPGRSNVVGPANFLASYLPARRAAKIAPVEALRYQ